VFESNGAYGSRRVWECRRKGVRVQGIYLCKRIGVNGYELQEVRME
jgi:hypothetical protein